MKKGCLLGIFLSVFNASACSQEKNLVFDERVLFQMPIYQKHSIKQILNAADDEDLVKISGKIIKKIKGKIYLFRGKTGEINVVIEESALPDRGIKLKSPVVIKGEVINSPASAPRIEVDDIHYVF